MVVAGRIFDSVWVSDHLMEGDRYRIEPWTQLTWLAARVPRVLLGHSVLANSYRHPALMAKMSASVQALSGGRFILGYGAGWLEDEYRAYGYPFPPTRERIARMDEALRLIKTMWTQSPATFEGEFYSVDEAWCEPRPDPLPPIMIGGSGERYLLRAVAEHADWWLSYGDVPEIQERKLAALADHCRDVGRDPATIRKVVPWTVYLHRDRNAARRWAGDAVEGDRPAFAGDPAELRDRIAEAAGARLRHDPAPVRRADGHDRHRAVRRRGAAPCPLTSARRVVPAAEFDLPAGHLDAPGLPAVRFPETGRPEADVLDDVRGRFDEDRFEPDRNFSITYSGIPSAISREVEALARGRFFVEWARETELGTWSMEREAVAMMASLLGGDGGAGGFITTGGTESNLAAMRLARNTGRQAEPEIIAPVTMHFSFRLGAELMGIRLVEIDVDDETYLPRIEDVERAITPARSAWSAPRRAAASACSTRSRRSRTSPGGRACYLHVDAAFGGFILPFMRDLGHAIPPFDLSLDGVSSISTDGHKLGLLPIATGFFLVKDAAVLEAIPTERTLIHTTSSTKPGSRAAAAWATLKHLGREGYVRVHGARPGPRRHHRRGRHRDPRHDARGAPVHLDRRVHVVVDRSRARPPAAGRGRLGPGLWSDPGKPFIRLSIHPSRDVEHAHAFVAAFEDAVARTRRA